MKKIIFASLALTSTLAMAEDHSITKVSKPGQVNIVKDGVGLTFFNLRFGDFPKTSIGKEKNLLKIEWETTSYPENPDEKVELCYYPYGSLRQETCNRISPNAWGETYAFNEQKFETYSYAVIKHHIKGGKQPARAAAQDKVIFHYSY